MRRAPAIFQLAGDVRGTPHTIHWTEPPWVCSYGD